MRILVRDECRDLNIVLPTRLVFSKTLVRIGMYFARKYAPETMESIPSEAVEKLLDEMHRIKKKYGSWDLVHVQSADGEEVLIRL